MVGPLARRILVNQETPRRMRLCPSFLLLVSMPLLAAPADPMRCDLMFAGGRVVDGTGSPAFRADVCVVEDRIAAVGDLSNAETKRRIEAANLIVCPGFIDML